MNSQDFKIGQTVYKIKKENNLILVIEAKNCVLINYVHIISDHYSYTNYIGHITECYSTREECIDSYKNYILEGIKSHENSVKEYKKLLKNDIFKTDKLHSIIDYIVGNYGHMSLSKLCSLLYYMQSYSLINYNTSFFNEDIIYIEDKYTERHGVTIEGINKVNLELSVNYILSEKDLDCIKNIITIFGDKSDRWLIDTINIELYLFDIEPDTDEVIDLESMKLYYTSHPYWHSCKEE